MTAFGRRRISAPSGIAPMLVFVLLGCTPMGYFKSGSTDEQVKQALTDCTEIARHQAFRDQPFLEFQLGLGYETVCVQRQAAVSVVPRREAWRRHGRGIL